MIRELPGQRGHRRRFQADRRPPRQSKQFEVADGLEMQLLASEPAVRQPLDPDLGPPRPTLGRRSTSSIPSRLGLKVVKYDQYLRAVFDKVPPTAPPFPRRRQNQRARRYRRRWIL